MDGKHIPFSSEDEAKIASAATWGSIVAITSLIGGGISLLATAMGTAQVAGTEQMELIAALVAAAFMVVINVWLLQACQAFRKVALTNEADQAYLLAGFRKLRAYFMIQVVMILVVFGIAIVAMFMAFSMAT